MKNRFFKFLSIFTLLLFVPGCSSENFFSVSNSADSPSNLYEQKDIIRCVKDHIGGDIKNKYPIYRGKYRSCILANFEQSDLQGEEHALFVCEKGSDSGEIHILFLKKVENKWEVFKDIKRTAADLEKIYIQDVDNDGNNEFAFVFKNSDKKRGNVYTYRYKDGDVSKVTIPNKFFNNFKDSDN